MPKTMVEATTYEQVGTEAGLWGKGLTLYVRYMRERWAKKEAGHCRFGYAKEWAERFKNHTEYTYSDSEGQAILLRMDI